MTITPSDDFPIHQASLPIAQTVDGDPNRYDRYFFHGYSVEHGAMFVVAFGLYPNREIVDAAVCFSQGGVQRSVFASGRAPKDRRDTVCGPVRIDVVEPLQVIRVRVDAPEQGIVGDLRFAGRSMPVQEPRQTMMDRDRVILDSTRFAQFGRWSGSLTVDGTDVAIVDWAGTRDRSWGVRPLPATVPTAPSSVLPELFWLWAPMQFDDHSVHIAVQENTRGRRAVDGSVVIPNGGEAVHERSATIGVRWVPGTRRASSAVLAVNGTGDGPDRMYSLEPVAKTFMRGVGYTHPEWAHGAWHGETKVGGEVLVHADLDPMEFSTLHCQQVVKVTRDDGFVGEGVLEQLPLGAHLQTGLTGFLDPWTA